MANHHGGISLQASMQYLLKLYSLTRGSILYKNAFYLVLNNICTSLLGFVFWNIMARFFTPAQVGVGSALVAASSLVSVMANMGLGVGLIRFVMDAEEKKNRLLNATFTLSGSIALAGSLLYLLGIKQLTPVLGFVRESFWLLIIFMFFTVANSLSTLTDCSLIAGRASYYVLHKNVLTSLLKFPLTIFIFSFLSGYGIFAGTGAGVLIGTLVAWLFFLPKVYESFYPRPVVAINIVQPLLPYSFANYVANLFNLAPQYIYPLLVINILGPEEGAYFWIAWMMTAVLAIIPSGVSQSLLAEGSHDPKKLGNDGYRVLLLSLSLTIPAVVAMIVTGNWLLYFFGVEYAEHGTGVVRFLALAVIPQCINVIFITVNQVKKRVHLIVIQTGILTATALGLGCWMLANLGLEGIGIAYALAHTAVAIIILKPLLNSLKE